MKEMLKIKPVVILAVSTVILFVLNIGSCVNSYSQNVARKKEMAARLDFEEKMTKANQEKSAALEKVRARDKELDDEKAAFQAAKKALAQEQLVGQNLKDELQRVNKLNEALEGNLKEALAINKKAKR